MSNLTSMPQPFDFEKIVDGSNRHQWMQNNWHQSLYWCTMYVVVVFSTKHYMKNRPAFDLRIPLIFWNLGLAVFCSLGTIRMIPALYHIVREFGLTFSLCDANVASSIHSTVFWTWLFLCSKIIELGDTMFIVLRKRKLIFLHWYHHAMTFILSWYLASQLVAVGHWFTVLNYAVHSLMYTYYTFRTLGIKLSRKIAMVLTIIELSQLIIGAFVSYWAISAKYQGYVCNFSNHAVLVSLCVYLSYILLFSGLFYTTYVCRKPTISTSLKED